MYYLNAIQSGHILVNGSQVDPTYIVQHDDLIIHHIHRHEPVVTSKPIVMIDYQDDFMVIDKPGGIPAHPGGRYRYNSVTQLLQRQLNVSRLFPANRLDLPTSGIMLIGLNVDGARRLWADTVEGRVQKEYLCRVVGKFPE
ncbi:pseudouridine synthase [Lichtheimia hyalospora FSU 10163]|nr:pseudouridine synthase [Lichtheimia hyalospora FSU 10163]